MKNYSEMTYEELVEESKNLNRELQYYEKLNYSFVSKACDYYESELRALNKYLAPMTIEKYLNGEI